MIDEYGTVLPLFCDATKLVMGVLMQEALRDGDLDRIMERLAIDGRFHHQTRQEVAALVAFFAMAWTREDRERGSRSWT